MSRIFMAVIVLMALSVISVSVIQDFLIDWEKQPKSIAKVEPTPGDENTIPSTADGEGQQPAVDDGFVE